MTSPTSGDSAAARYPRTFRVDVSLDRELHVALLSPGRLSLSVFGAETNITHYFTAHEAAALAHALREAVLMDDAIDELTPEDPQLPF